MADLSHIDEARNDAVLAYRRAIEDGADVVDAVHLAADGAFELGREAGAGDMERIEREARADELEAWAAATLRRANEVRANVGLDAPRIDVVHADGSRPTVAELFTEDHVRRLVQKIESMPQGSEPCPWHAEWPAPDCKRCAPWFSPAAAPDLAATVRAILSALAEDGRLLPVDLRFSEGDIWPAESGGALPSDTPALAAAEVRYQWALRDAKGNLDCLTDVDDDGAAPPEPEFPGDEVIRRLVGPWEPVSDPVSVLEEETRNDG